MTPAEELSHVDDRGRARMVDVTDKDVSERRAVAEGRVLMQAGTADRIRANTLQKGDVLVTAELAGVMAAKRTHDLIPLCHPLALSHIDVECRLSDDAQDGFGGAVSIRAAVRSRGRTGVEMEALTAVGVAALTVYDMAKAIDRGMRISDVRLRHKSGGRSGTIDLD
jgi:cyclic pyranopterin phosphate synthase